jgi:hemolysin activation/secretion protein
MPPKAEPVLNLPSDQRPPLRAPSALKVKVNAFRITGTQAVSQAQLQAIIANYNGKELSLGNLEQAAADITTYYRSQGYMLARAYLPAQDINNGTVEIAVLEGKLGQASVNTAQAPQLNAAFAQKIIQNNQKTGVAVKESDLERGLLLLNDLPGVTASADLSPGANTGETNLAVSARQDKRFGGSIEADNYGNKYAGANRIGATAYANNLSGYGDQLTAKAMTSDESLEYGRLAYSSAVGSDGLRLGLAQTHLRYKLGDTFKYLNASGTVDSTSAFALYPIVRSRNANLYVQGTLETKAIKNDAKNARTDDKTADVYGLGLNGDWRDDLGGGAVSTYGATMNNGKLNGGMNMDSVTGESSDSYNTKGDYSKTNYNLSRLQTITPNVSFYVGLNGQLASKNLDSSEKMSLGGPNGVRAYGTGEAAGDEGYIASAELRYLVPGAHPFGAQGVQLTTFIDNGHITLQHTPFAGVKNARELTGAGVGINLIDDKYTVRASYAWKANGSEAATSTPDNDGRAWLQGIVWF